VGSEFVNTVSTSGVGSSICCPHAPLAVAPLNVTVDEPICSILRTLGSVSYWLRKLGPMSAAQSNRLRPPDCRVDCAADKAPKEPAIADEIGHHMSVNHLSNGDTISRFVRHLLEGFDPAGMLLLFSSGRSISAASLSPLVKGPRLQRPLA
jgi:hypothetical protein